MFTPVHTSLGALLLFGASFGLLLHNGRVFGISSILRAGLRDRENAAILAGLMSSPLLVSLVVPSLLPSYTTSVPSWSSTASTLGLGVLTGWGTKVSLFFFINQENKIINLTEHRMTMAAHPATCFADSRDSRQAP